MMSPMLVMILDRELSAIVNWENYKARKANISDFKQMQGNEGM